MRTMPIYPMAELTVGGAVAPFVGDVVVRGQAWKRGLIVADVPAFDNSTGVSAEERCRT